MPTTLNLSYTARMTVSVPTAIAKKLTPIACDVDGIPWRYYIKWGTLHYWDDDLVEHKIVGVEGDSDWKYDMEDERFWDDAESSDDEDDDSSDEESDCEFCGEPDEDAHECIPERSAMDALYTSEDPTELQ